MRAHWLAVLQGIRREPLLEPGGPTAPVPEAAFVPAGPAAALRRIAGDDQVGLHLLLLAATRLCLSAFGAARDMPVLCPSPGDPDAELALRTRLDQDTPMTGFLTSAHADLLAATPFAWRHRASLAAQLETAGAAESDALAQLAVRWEASGSPGRLPCAAVEVRGRLEEDGTLRVRVLSPHGRVPVAVQNLPRCIAAALSDLGRDPRRPARELDVLGPQQRAEVERWSGLPLPDACPALSLLDLVDATAARGGDRIAVVDGTTRLTYDDLMRHTAALADELRTRHGVGRGDRVAVLLPRGASLVVAVLAVLRAGAAYVPVDPAHPEQRISHLLRLSGATLLIGDRPPAGTTLPAVPSDRVLASRTGAEAARGPAPHVRPEDEAVLFFTSGSTGLPRPVSIRHDQMCHKAVSSAAQLGIDADVRCALLSALTSDATAYQIFVTLGVGGTLVAMGAPDELDPVTFWERIRTERVSLLNCVPGLLSAMLEALPPTAGLPLPHLILGGDAVPRGLMARTRGRLRIGRLVNLYGPCEATVECVSYVCPGDRAAELMSVPIGSPSPGFGVLLVTEWGTLAPVGVPGEIYVAGPGVAAGYLNAPEATAERFVPCPAADAGHSFRTGDLARWNADGTLEFLGRIDGQVQLHGQRVEPGEVEQALVRLAGVREAVVLPRPAGRDSVTLAAWYTADAPLEPGVVRSLLASELPAHMVPRLLTQLPALPRTPHGKIDRTALAASPDRRAEDVWTPYDAASRTVADAWEAVFGQPPRSGDDDFFEAGGHSLTAAQLVSALCAAEPECGVAVRQIFIARTPEALAEAVRQGLRAPRPSTGAPAAAAAPQAPSGPAAAGPAEASNAQRRMWLLEALDEGALRAYNMVEAYELDRPLSEEALRAGVHAVAVRHESLRTTFELPRDGAGAVLRQVVHDIGDMDLAPQVQRVAPERLEAALAAARDEETRWRFDLAAGPLFRLRYLSAEGRRPVLLFNVHHSVNDGWSYSVLLRDLLTAAGAFEAGRAPALGALPGYRAHTRALADRLAAGSGAVHSAYWRRTLGDLPPLPPLPGDHVPGAVRGSAGGQARVTLDGELTDALRALAVRATATPFMVCVAASRVLLHRLTGLVDLPLGTVVAGRSAPGLAEEVGLFANTVVLRTAMDPAGTFADLLERVRRTALDVQEHEEYPFDRIVEDLAVERTAGRNPLFDVLVETVMSPTVTAGGGDGSRTARHLDEPPQVGDFDLSFGFLLPEAGAARHAEIRVGHRLDRYTAHSAVRIGEQLRDVLEAVLREPDAPLGALLATTPDDRTGPARTTTDLVLSENAVHALARISGGRAAEELVVLTAAVALATADIDGTPELRVQRASAQVRCPVDVTTAATPADLVMAVDRAVRTAAPAQDPPRVLVASETIAPPAGRATLSATLLRATDAGRRVLRLEWDTEETGQRTAEALRHRLDQALGCFAKPRGPLPDRIAPPAAPAVRGTDNGGNL
ncbi:amino acid adenylation domain-containing protein [Streptomyces actinomycinicus]|uniref:Amino acid adenylation domain-containing protein n=1 Tax=Streptomyces actinomycinicus TaxID=1695166 RepID=A0A937JMH7_9ACTN|nr:non-ribosomal peptide synthetase [Streptomyces actinomycinicus]MBL1082331.1 amino acid adenylation domain-containing protein [Streptomyces actinomycinicus]